MRTLRPIGASLRGPIADSSTCRVLVLRMQLLLGVGVDASAGAMRVMRRHRVRRMELGALEASRAEALRQIGIWGLRNVLGHLLGRLDSRASWSDGGALQLHFDLENLALKVLVGLLQVVGRA